MTALNLIEAIDATSPCAPKVSRRICPIAEWFSHIAAAEFQAGLTYSWLSARETSSRGRPLRLLTHLALYFRS
jgi:hypothetical protein